MGIITGGIIAKLYAKEYAEPVKSIELTSQHVSYANGDPGSWHVTKSAKWIEQNRARITFDVDTIAQASSDADLDIVMVVDDSGSMEGDKIELVKRDSIELIESVLADTNNRIGLVGFNSEATKLSVLTSDKDVLIRQVSNLTAIGGTNYYGAFLKAEDVLSGYEKQSGRELILLFLTDGLPNEQNPNEIAEYRALKAAYPYMTINAIQYEMGSDILGSIRDISDNQFVADMDSLNNVLFEAAIAPHTYESFTLMDRIDNNYWNVGSIDDISATVGEVMLSYDGETPVVTWNVVDLLRSGQSAQLTIDITLRDNSLVGSGDYLPTNDGEEISTRLPNILDEDVYSELTPVLRTSYKVAYEPNLPSACDSYEGTLPAEQSYPPLSVVEKSSDYLSCDGYIFVGWDIAEGDPKVINDDYFRIQEDDIVLRATWTKLSISKSMNGAVIDGATAVLDVGTNINVAMKVLSGQENAVFDSTNSTIKAVRAAVSMSSMQQRSATVISSPDSPISIYAWYDDADNAIYVYTDADEIRKCKMLFAVLAHL